MPPWTPILAALVLILATPSIASARTTQLASGIGALAGARGDGTFAFKNTATTVRYGNATTGRIRTVTIPAQCYPAAATAGAALLQCSQTDPHASGGSSRAPIILNTRTGALTTVPGGAFRTDTTYDGIGAHWISGTFDPGNKGQGRSFVSRDSGTAAPNAPSNAAYDLDTSGTPTPLLITHRRRGTVAFAQSGAYVLASTSHVASPSSSYVQFELDRDGRRVKVLGRCQVSCAFGGLSTTTAMWRSDKSVMSYDIQTGKTKTTTFARSSAILATFLQPHQTLALVRSRSGTSRVYRIT